MVDYVPSRGVSSCPLNLGGEAHTPKFSGHELSKSAVDKGFRTLRPLNSRGEAVPLKFRGHGLTRLSYS